MAPTIPSFGAGKSTSKTTNLSSSAGISKSKSKPKPKSNAAIKPSVVKQGKDISTLGDSIIIVNVGSESEPFYAHRNLIAASSDFFRNALSGEFKEKDGKVKLPTTSSTSFRVYMHWLYFQEICSIANNNGAAETPKPTILDWRVLLDSYILGDFIRDKRFCNAIVDVFINKQLVEGYYPNGLAASAYANLPEQSPFRKLLVDFYVFGISGSKANDDRKDGPKEFWVDVAMKFGEMRAIVDLKKARPWEQNRCQYHQHEKDQPRCND